MHADSPAGAAVYDGIRRRFLTEVERLPPGLRLQSNGQPAAAALRARLVATLNPELFEDRRASPAVTAPQTKPRVPSPTFDRPVFIVAAPRSGSTLLFECLAQNRQFWTLGDESHAEFESLPALHPLKNGRNSNRLDEGDLSPRIATQLTAAFLRRLRDSEDRLLAELPDRDRPVTLRFLEKTPKNALRVPFLAGLFPDARFVFLHREPRGNLGSIIDAWLSGRFVTYPNLPGWDGPAWSLLLPPGWEGLKGKQIAEIAAFQWLTTNEQLATDLHALPADRWTSIGYDALLADPATEIRRLCEFADVPFGPRMRTLAEGKLPTSKYTLSPPAPDKWRRHEAALAGVLPGLQKLADRLAALEPI